MSISAHEADYLVQYLSNAPTWDNGPLSDDTQFYIRRALAGKVRLIERAENLLTY